MIIRNVCVYIHQYRIKHRKETYYFIQLVFIYINHILKLYIYIHIVYIVFV